MVIRPLLNDRDPDGDPVTIVAIRAPRHGIATMTATTVTYTAVTYAAVAGSAYTVGSDMFRADSIGTDSVGYTIGDGRGGLATASVTIHVVPAAPLPVTGRDVLAVTRAGLLALTAGGALCLLADRDRGYRRRR